MYNTVPVNGWPQIKALEGTDSLPATIDARITAIETWIESVAPTDDTAAATREALEVGPLEEAEPVKKKATRKKVVDDGK